MSLFHMFIFNPVPLKIYKNYTQKKVQYEKSANILFIYILLTTDLSVFEGFSL